MVDTATAIQGFGFVEHLSYIGFFLIIGFSGYAVPVPEEILLVIAGYLAAIHVVSLPLIMIACVAGAIVGDSVIFYLSGHGSRFTQKYHSKVEGTHVGWYIRHMKENTGRTVFISRFIVGLRFLNPLVSGLLKVRAKTFVSATALSAVIFLPIIISLGYIFHNQIDTVIHYTQSFHHLMVFLVAAATTIIIGLFFKNLWERSTSS